LYFIDFFLSIKIYVVRHIRQQEVSRGEAKNNQTYTFCCLGADSVNIDHRHRTCMLKKTELKGKESLYFIH